MQALPFLALGLSAGGQIAGGIAQSQQASYQSQVAKNNAITAERNALYAAQVGATKTEQEGLKEAQRAGQVKTAIAANNVDVDSGSSADVQTSQREIGLLNTATVANNSALQVYGYEAQKENFQAQAKLYGAEETPDILGGIEGAASSALQASPYLPGKFSWMQGGGGDSTGAGATVASDFEFVG